MVIQSIFTTGFLGSIMNPLFLRVEGVTRIKINLENSPEQIGPSSALPNPNASFKFHFVSFQNQSA